MCLGKRSYIAPGPPVTFYMLHLHMFAKTLITLIKYPLTQNTRSLQRLQPLLKEEIRSTGYSFTNPPYKSLGKLRLKPPFAARSPLFVLLSWDLISHWKAVLWLAEKSFQSTQHPHQSCLFVMLPVMTTGGDPPPSVGRWRVAPAHMHQGSHIFPQHEFIWVRI